MTLPELWISIDPGDAHVGYATWEGSVCVSAVELSPLTCEMQIAVDIERGLGLIVYEKFMLYGWLAQQQAGSEMETAQLIGVIKHLARKAGVACVSQQASARNAVISKYPMRGGSYTWKAYGHGTHAKDAEAHGLTWIRKQAVVARRAG